MAEKKRAIALAGGGPAVGLRIGADTECEGAIVDAVNSCDLLWLSADGGVQWNTPTKDSKQIRQTANPYDAPHNLVMLFTAIASEDEDDVKLFKSKFTENGRDTPRIENPIDASISRANISSDWGLENLGRSIACGGRAINCATSGVLSAYRNTTGDVTVAKLQAASNDAA
jgi:hypothetical protein